MDDKGLRHITRRNDYANDHRAANEKTAEVVEMYKEREALKSERDALRDENAALRDALNSAGEWIVGADVATEPGWEGSTRHILAKIETALANTPAQEPPDTSMRGGADAGVRNS